MASWHMIDFIEVSGGDYETPGKFVEFGRTYVEPSADSFFLAEFMSSNPLSKSPRQAFFAQFSRRAMEALTLSPKTVLKASPLILLTGGLRTPSHLETAIISRHADLLGIGRGSVTCPDLPDVLRQMENESKQAGDAYTLFAPEPNLALGFFGSDWITRWVWTFMSRIQLIGAGARMAWYVVMIRRLASKGGERNVQMDYDMGAVGAIFKMWITTDGMSLTAFAAAGFALLLACLWCCIQRSQQSGPFKSILPNYFT
jgi:hypothetical protein